MHGRSTFSPGHKRNTIPHGYMLQVTKVLQFLRYLACLTSHLWSVDDDANTGPPNAVITQPDRLFQSKKTAENS